MKCFICKEKLDAIKDDIFYCEKHYNFFCKKCGFSNSCKKAGCWLIQVMSNARTLRYLDYLKERPLPLDIRICISKYSE